MEMTAAKIRTQDIAYIAIFTALMAVCSWISIPTAIPFTLQTMAVFLAVFAVAGIAATSMMGITETLPVLYLLKWCVGLFLTMLPCLAAMWAITVLFEKPLLSVGLNLLLVIPGILVATRRSGLLIPTVTAAIWCPAPCMTLQRKPLTPHLR